jgi:hypothetical protein
VDGTLYQHFVDNLTPVNGVYTAVRLPSLQASDLYADQSLDFVMLDAGHDHDSVRADILAWLPKVKTGGILAGDDYEHNWPGVIQAVDELLPQRQVTGVTWSFIKNTT